MEGRCLEDLEEKYESVNELMNHKGVCRTAPTTPGPLISLDCIGQIFRHFKIYFVQFC